MVERVKFHTRYACLTLIFVAETCSTVVGAFLAYVRSVCLIGHITNRTLQEALVLEVEFVDCIASSWELAAEAFVRPINAGLARIHARLAARVCSVTIEAVDALVNTCVTIEERIDG